MNYFKEQSEQLNLANRKFDKSQNRHDLTMDNISQSFHKVD